MSRVEERRVPWPVTSLALLTGLNLLDYVDRYILAAVLPLLRGELRLSYEQAGTLTTGFMLGYFLTSPIFGYLGDRLPRRWLVAAGVFVWSLGTLFSGHAHVYVTLLLFRALVGFGEASFGTISPGWIADLFPASRRNDAISVFYFAIPVGSAIGYLFGGVVAVHFGWRAAFLGAGYPGLALALLLFLLREPSRGASDPPSLAHASFGGTSPPSPRFGPGSWSAYLELLGRPRYLLAVAGYTAQTFAMGGFSQWAPTFLYEVHHMKLDAAAFFFGTSLAVSGLVATLVGGFTATRWQRRGGSGYAWMLAGSSLAATPFAIAALATSDLAASKALLVATMFLLFLSTGPINTLILETVPARMRATSMAASIFAIHMFGDLWSPKFVGHFADVWGDLRSAMLWVLPGALAVSAFFWCWLALRKMPEGHSSG